MPAAASRPVPAGLRPALERLYRQYDDPGAAADPIQIVRRYASPADREIAGFCAAALAFGRVASVLHSVDRVLDVLGPAPAAFVGRFDPRRDGGPLRTFVHRWASGRDVIALLWILRHMLEAGSIEAYFLRGARPGAEDVSAALDSFSARARAIDLRPVYGRQPRTPGVHYFFPRPSAGSACKRLNLFLRWMVRRDRVDPGVWSRVSPAGLVVPLDTHVIRVGRCLGLTSRLSPGWRMAAEITASLRALDARDPVKYDFSLCHLGMADVCGFGRARGDAGCPLAGYCHPHGVVGQGTRKERRRGRSVKRVKARQG